MELLNDLYIKKEKNNFFKGFTKEQLLSSIEMKNLERLILKNKIRKNRIIEIDQLKKNNFSKVVNKKLLKSYQLKKNISILRYFWSFFNYYYQIWNFKKFLTVSLVKYNNKFKNFIIPQVSKNVMSRNFYSYLFSAFARSENDNYRFNSKLYLKTFTKKLQKNWIQVCPIYSYFKFFERYAFNQKFLLFYLFEVNQRTLTHIFKAKSLKRVINTFIFQNDLKTLKHLKFYKRKVTARRTYKRR